MYLLGNLNIWESFHFENKSFRFTRSSITVNMAMPWYGGSIFCWVSVVETEDSKSDLVAPVWLDWDSTGPLSVLDKLSAGLFSLVYVNCSGSFSIFPLWTFHLYVATFQQHLHMEYMSLRWYDIPELVVPIRISLIEGCC
jgi:hypothetical protein